MHDTLRLPSSVLAVALGAALGAPAGAYRARFRVFQAALLGNVKDTATKEALCYGSTSSRLP
jgi:hypothetical protein